MSAGTPTRRTAVDIRWGLRIPMRDGVHLHGTLYTPGKAQTVAAPAICTLTPYIAQNQYDRGIYFASHGFPFLAVDARGRGNSQGEFRPYINEARDGYDVVEWLAQQPCCNGKVAMYGGSYMGYCQWVTANEAPPHLQTIVPVSSVYMGFDFPTRANIGWPYVMQWLSLVSGTTAQEKLFLGRDFWSAKYRQLVESGIAFSELDTLVGNPCPTFHEWLDHPCRDGYWEQFNPSRPECAKLSLPILTITGIYDNAQLGALTHYREHLEYASAAARARHYLVIGPWEHSGTRSPRTEFAGLRLGAASAIDMLELHADWYTWTLQGGPKPQFLKKRVTYYVTGSERWRWCDTLAEVTASTRVLYLDSTGEASRIFASGTLDDSPGSGSYDTYAYDPSDTRLVELEAQVTDPHCLRPTFPTDNLTDQRLLYAREGCQLVYHSKPFAVDTEISGFFKLSVWLSIDQPDTDFAVAIYEIDIAGRSLLLSADSMRARYRESLYEETLIRTTEALHYEFRRFTFVSHMVRTGSRLRLVLGPIDSIYYQKNYNSGGIVAEETLQDARTVSVRLFHDRDHPSALHVPLGQTTG